LGKWEYRKLQTTQCRLQDKESGGLSNLTKVQKEGCQISDKAIDTKKKAYLLIGGADRQNCIDKYNIFYINKYT
jgi:hypothetical protein